MEQLLEKAAERIKEGTGCSEQFILMACQCGQMMPAKQEKVNFEEAKELFSHICDFCRKHNMCPECCEEELPFP